MKTKDNKYYRQQTINTNVSNPLKVQFMEQLEHLIVLYNKEKAIKKKSVTNQLIDYSVYFTAITWFFRNNADKIRQKFHHIIDLRRSYFVFD